MLPRERNERMTVETTRFGVVEIDDNSQVQMTSGLLGFEDHARYCLIDHSPEANFRWLQSMEDPGLAFVVVNPYDYFADYTIEISDADAAKLGLTKEEDAIVMTIVTLDKDASRITANLAAPIVVNSKNLRAAQVVLQDERYPIRHPLFGTSVAEPVVAKAA